MKKLVTIPSLVAALLLSGCMPSIGGGNEEVIQENEETIEETVMIPDVQLKDEFYRTLLPFKKSASRGLIVNQLRSKYDIQEAEKGLLRLSAMQFDPKDYYFQEGQYIDEKTARTWLARSSTEEKGLNPPVKDGMSEEDIAAEAPIYLSHIIEQNYLVMTDEKKVRLAGISIGLAMNSISYTRSGSETPIPQSKIQDEGMKMAEEIVKRMRAQEELKDIPIVVGLFKQESRNSIVPGTYFARAVADKGAEKPTGWKEVNEQYIVFPTPSSIERYREINTTFEHFKQDIDTYFPSFVDVIGTGFFKDGKLSSLRIEIPIQFYGSSEIIGFTQYVTSLTKKYFPDIHTEVNITSVNGTEALIVSEPRKDAPYVHIYGY